MVGSCEVWREQSVAQDNWASVGAGLGSMFISSTSSAIGANCRICICVSLICFVSVYVLRTRLCRDGISSPSKRLRFIPPGTRYPLSTFFIGVGPLSDSRRLRLPPIGRGNEPPPPPRGSSCSSGRASMLPPTPASPESSEVGPELPFLDLSGISISGASFEVEEPSSPLIC
jgi:hypothetical protein